MAGTITAANSKFTITIPGVFNNAVTLQGYAVDEAVDTDAVDAAEIQVGVDGTGVAGWVPRQVPQMISLLATSPSNAVFDNWLAAQDTIQDIIYGSASLRIPSLGHVYKMAKGVITRMPQVPNIRRVVQPRQFTITWLPQPGVPPIIKSPI